MPKMKTSKTASKRFTITGSGKLMRTRGGKSHLRRNKASRVKGEYDEMHPVSPADESRVKRLLPYGS
ncbi:MAG: 50S ribosomal protein L35 [Chloroflexota bacterium]|jgi:large subunit ribosomal protein L35